MQIGTQQNNALTTQLLATLQNLNASIGSLSARINTLGMVQSIPPVATMQQFGGINVVAPQYVPVVAPTPAQLGTTNLYSTASPAFFQAIETRLLRTIFQQAILRTPEPFSFMTPLESEQRQRQTLLYSNLPRWGVQAGATAALGALLTPILGPLGLALSTVLGPLIGRLVPTPGRLLRSEIGASMQTLLARPERLGYKGPELAEVSRLEYHARTLSRELYGFNYDRIRELTRELAQTSLLRGVRSVDEYKSTMEKLLKNLRSITGALRLTYSDAINFMETINRMGIPNAPEYANRLAYQMRNYAATLRVNEAALTTNVVNQAQQLYNLGYSGQSAMQISLAPTRFLSAFSRAFPEQYRRIVGERDEEVLSGLQTIMGGLIEHPLMRYMMISAVNPTTQNGRISATVDYAMLSRMLSGQVSLEEAMQTATRKLQNSNMTWVLTSPSAMRSIVEQLYERDPMALVGMMNTSIKSSEMFRAARMMAGPEISDEEIMRNLLVDVYRLPSDIADRISQLLQTAQQNPDILASYDRNIRNLADYEQAIDAQRWSRLDTFRRLMTAPIRFFSAIGERIRTGYARFIDNLTLRRYATARLVYEQHLRPPASFREYSEPLQSVFGVQPFTTSEMSFVNPETNQIQTMQVTAGQKNVAMQNIRGIYDLGKDYQIYRAISPSAYALDQGIFKQLSDKVLTAEELRTIMNEILGRSILGMRPLELRQMLDNIENTIENQGKIKVGDKEYTKEQWKALSEEERQKLAYRFFGQNAAEQAKGVSLEQVQSQLQQIPEFRTLTRAGQQQMLLNAMADYQNFAKNPNKWFAEQRARAGYGIVQRVPEMPKQLERTLLQMEKEISSAMKSTDKKVQANARKAYEDYMRALNLFRKGQIMQGYEALVSSDYVRQVITNPQMWESLAMNTNVWQSQITTVRRFSADHIQQFVRRLDNRTRQNLLNALETGDLQEVQRIVNSVYGNDRQRASNIYNTLLNTSRQDLYNIFGGQMLRVSANRLANRQRTLLGGILPGFNNLVNGTQLSYDQYSNAIRNISQRFVNETNAFGQLTGYNTNFEEARNVIRSIGNVRQQVETMMRSGSGPRGVGVLRAGNERFAVSSGTLRAQKETIKILLQRNAARLPQDMRRMIRSPEGLEELANTILASYYTPEIRRNLGAGVNALGAYFSAAANLLPTLGDISKMSDEELNRALRPVLNNVRVNNQNLNEMNRLFSAGGYAARSNVLEESQQYLQEQMYSKTGVRFTPRDVSRIARTFVGAGLISTVRGDLAQRILNWYRNGTYGLPGQRNVTSLVGFWSDEEQRIREIISTAALYPERRDITENIIADILRTPRLRKAATNVLSDLGLRATDTESIRSGLLQAIEQTRQGVQPYLEQGLRIRGNQTIDLTRQTQVQRVEVVLDTTRLEQQIVKAFSEVLSKYEKTRQEAATQMANTMKNRGVDVVVFLTY